MSLIELMVSLLLGLLVASAAITAFMANKQAVMANEHLARTQETARVAFELMARDLREAGGLPCDMDVELKSVLDASGATWLTRWDAPAIGFADDTPFPDGAFGTLAGERIAGTDAVELHSATLLAQRVAHHDPVSATITLESNRHGFASADVVVACDFSQAVALQLTDAADGSPVISHAVSGGFLPGNTRTCLSSDGSCSGSGSVRTYSLGCFRGRRLASGTCADSRPWPAMLAKLASARWYVGGNARGGTSLFRTTAHNNGGVIVPRSVEVIDGVTDLDIKYMVEGAYVPAASVSNWKLVSAVLIKAAMSRPDGAGTGRSIDRTVEHIVELRNRAQ